jgi:hypothetical protein
VNIQQQDQKALPTQPTATPPGTKAVEAPLDAPQRVEAQMARILPIGKGAQPPPGSQVAPQPLPGPSVPAAEVVKKPRPATSPKLRPPRPALCRSCWQRGHAACANCMVAHDSGLELRGGSVFRVRPPKEEDLWPWRRCEVCGDPFQAPPFGVPNRCAKCRHGMAKTG